MTHTILIIIFSVLLLAGSISVLFFIFPSLPVMFLIAFAYGFIDHFQHITGLDLVILGGIAILAEGIDFVSGIWGAKLGGASRDAIIIGIVGLIIGLITFPPFGSVIGLFLGILLAEILHFKDIVKALKAAGGGLLGSLLGMIIKVILAILFLVLFIIFALK